MSSSLPQTTIAQALQQTQLDIAATDARILLQRVLNVSYAHLIAHPGQELAPEQAQQFYSLASRRAAGEPVAYLVGEREFYSLSFKVTPAVLIPRPETELLVDLALERVSTDRSCKVLDLGTGSGAVAIIIAKHRPLASITAVDSSAAAMVIARMNAEHLVATNVRMLAGDWFSGVAGEEFDLIVSNPPYVADGDPHLEQGDLRFEPHTALAAGSDGLDCIRRIITAAPTYLIAGGWLLLEHGYDQAAACRQMLSKAGFSEAFSHPDLAGTMRVSGGKRQNSPVQSC
jgi:release factor glutamine methyltransferase